MKIDLDENILVKGRYCLTGSKMLYNFKPPYSAAVVEKILKAGMFVAVKSLDNADAGLSLIFKNIKDGVNIKPTYGTVSRFGVIANASSMDSVRVNAKNLDDAFTVLSVIAGSDKNDPTLYPAEKYNYSPENINISELKIIESPDFKLKDCLLPVEKIISSAEFSANISRFDGLNFGFRPENYKNINELIIDSRSECFDYQTKFKALTGAYVLSEDNFEKYYLKAAKIRRLIKRELDGIFDNFDIIALPIENLDIAEALINLTGFPAVIIKDKILISKEFEENKLYALGRSLEK